MHASWFMYLFILILFGLFSSGQASYYSDDTEEIHIDLHNDLVNSMTTTHSILGETEEEIVDSDDEKKKTVETTTEMKKTTKHHHHSNHEPEEYYDHEDEEEDEKASSTTHTTTRLLSSSSTTRLSAHAITETTTSKAEIPLRRSTLSTSTDLYHIFLQNIPTTTIDPRQIARYLAITNRDRLFLQIFVITVAISMVILAIVLIIIHRVRKARRYGGYCVPANTSSNEQSKTLNNIRI